MTPPKGFVVPMDHQDAKQVPTRLDAWRRKNPDAFGTWETKHGCVVQFWGFRIYYGTCTRCGGLVHTRRYVADKNGHPLGYTGSWPRLCSDCRDARERERADSSRKSMARLRRQRTRDRATQFTKQQMTPPRQGVPAKDRLGQPIIDTPDDDDDWFDHI